MKQLFAALVSAMCASAFAGPIQLVKDINRTVDVYVDTQVGNGHPVAFGSSWLLTLCSDSAGCEPWITDGTSTGTRMLTDLWPGPFESRATNYRVMGAHAYFQGSGTAGYSLYRTDGTEGGTGPVAPMSSSRAFTISNSTIYFVGVNGQLWKSDGTPGAAVQLSTSIDPRELTPLWPDKVVFRDENSKELWVSDGTVAGTTLLKALNPLGVTGGEPTGLAAVSGRVFFWAHDSDFSSPVLFVTDGTAGGTQKVAEIESAPWTRIVEHNTKAAFLAWGPHGISGLWVSDGTSAGTTLLRSWSGDPLAELVEAGGYLYFRARDPALGSEIWRSDGTVAGTMLASDVHPGPGSSDPMALVRVGSAVYFSAWDGVYRVYKIQGTAPASGGLGDFRLPRPFAALGDRVLLAEGFSGAWLSDGTDAGTVPFQVTEGQPSGDAACAGGHAVMGGFVYFVANDGVHGCELWRSDGTPAGTALVKDLAPGVAGGMSRHTIGVAQFAATATLVFFADEGQNLWRTDGTAAGTIQLASFPHGELLEIVTVGQTAYFPTRTAAEGQELWKSDGTPAGTVIVRDLNPGSGDSSPLGLAGFQGSVYFEVTLPGGVFLARSDGTAAGTFTVAALPAGAKIKNLVAGQSRLYFSLTTAAAGEEAWRSDGTAAGTIPVKDLFPGSGSGVTQSINGMPPLFATMGDHLFFTGTTSSSPQAAGIYRTDGTSSGTVFTHLTHSTPYWAVLGSRFFYISVHTGATICNQTIPSGFGIPCLNMVSTPVPRPLIATPSTIFYLAESGAEGTELWMTHGNGQQIVEDFAAGTASLEGPYYNQGLRAAVLPNGVFFFMRAANGGQEPHFLAYDTTPNPTTFATAQNVARDVDVISAPVKVSGINSLTPFFASGGEVCVSSEAGCACDVAPYNTGGTVHFNQYLCVKHRSQATFGSSTTTTLSIGGVAASFTSTTPAAHPLTVSVAGTGAGTVVASQPGINCPGDCSESYPQGSTVTLYASRLPGSTFAGWSGGCTGFGACVVNLAAPVSVTATFSIAAMEPARQDFNGDGRSDLLWRNSGGGYGAWVMNGLTSFGAGNVSAGPGAVIKQVGDFNGDGRKDVVWRRADGSYQMDLMNGLSVVGTATILAAGTGWELVHKGDFNGDGKTDLVWKGPTGTIGMWLMNGLTFTTGGTAAHPGVGFDVVQVADFSGDGKSDLLWRHTDGRINIALMDGLNSIGGTQLLGIANGWSPTHVGDLDDDGRMDIAWQHTNGSIGLWLMNGLSIKQVATPMGSGTGWSLAAMADLDGDGKMDLLWSRNDGTQAVWIMNGVTAQDYGVFFGAGNGWSVAATGDYDGDGKDDIVWKHADGRHQVWLMHGMAVKGTAQLVGAGSGWSVQP